MVPFGCLIVHEHKLRHISIGCHLFFDRIRKLDFHPRKKICRNFLYSVHLYNVLHCFRVYLYKLPPSFESRSLPTMSATSMPFPEPNQHEQQTTTNSSTVCTETLASEKEQRKLANARRPTKTRRFVKASNNCGPNTQLEL
jgi:hypothetical protein